MTPFEQDMRIRTVNFRGTELQSFDGKPLELGSTVIVGFRANAHFKIQFERGDRVKIVGFPEPGSGWVDVTNGTIRQTVYASDLIVSPEHYAKWSLVRP